MLDSQKIEIIGRNRLVTELLQAGLEVAEPIRDRGVDLIAYLDIDDEIERFIAFPIQLKVSSDERFSVMRKYDKFPNLILAYVWGVNSSSEGTTYALTQREAIVVAEKMEWTRTASWERGVYHSIPSKRLRVLLEAHRMTPETWRSKLLGMV